MKERERNKQRKKQTKKERKDIGEKSKRATTSKRNNTTKGFRDFYDKLKIIERLVSVPDRLRRFVATCIRGTEYAPKAGLFLKAIHVLYDKRWGEVTAFCEKLSEKLPVLEQTWSEDKFKEERANLDAHDKNHEGGGGHSFQPSEITRVLHDALFHCYLFLIIAINHPLEELAAWADAFSNFEFRNIRNRFLMLLFYDQKSHHRTFKSRGRNFLLRLNVALVTNICKNDIASTCRSTLCAQSLARELERCQVICNVLYEGCAPPSLLLAKRCKCWRGSGKMRWQS